METLIIVTTQKSKNSVNKILVIEKLIEVIIARVTYVIVVVSFARIASAIMTLLIVSTNENLYFILKF